MLLVVLFVRFCTEKYTLCFAISYSRILNLFSFLFFLNLSRLLLEISFLLSRKRQRLVYRLPAQVIRRVSRTVSSIMSSENSYVLHSLSPLWPRYGGPAVVLWLLLERNEFLQLQHTELRWPALTHCFPSHPQERMLPAHSSVPGEGRGLLWSSSLFTASKFISFLLWSYFWRHSRFTQNWATCIHPTNNLSMPTSLSPLKTTSLFNMSMSLFQLCIHIHLLNTTFLPSIHWWTLRIFHICLQRIMPTWTWVCNISLASRFHFFY